jgi:hypothetical protein
VIVNKVKIPAGSIQEMTAFPNMLLAKFSNHVAMLQYSVIHPTQLLDTMQNLIVGHHQIG